MTRIAATVTVVLGTMLLPGSVGAQWPDRPAIGIPRTPDGKPDLSARLPAGPDGRPDLSGIWLPDPGSAGTKGIGESLRSPYFVDVTSDLDPAKVPFQPWAEAQYRRHRERNMMDDPTARCQPTGVPALDTYPFPFKVLQLRGLVVILYENNTDFRQIFIDGREAPRDPTPTWMGYSVGKWEGDTLVVESIGFNDRSWLDRSGHPHSESLRVIERFRRMDVGRMEITITIDDPKTYTGPITFTQAQKLLPDAELLEHFCTDNEKSSQHFQ
ncbi:MAG: hypothetical protein ABI868_10635 [Acidobacteriota bacterium]